MHRYHDRQETHTAEHELSLVTITLLGGFSVVVDGVPTSSRGWERRTAASLVKILALASGNHLHRERVMDLLWPDESPERAAPRLHKAAHFARIAAGRHDAVVLRDDVVWLFPSADLVVDAIRFEQLARTAVTHDDQDAAREAMCWYGGELLPADQYEDWAVDRREILALRRLDVLRVAAEWREVAELDPTDEEAHTQLMRRHMSAGDGEAALRQYRHLERVLDRELGVAPGEAARRASIEASDLQTAPEVPLGSRVESLLAELTELVNRQTAVLTELASTGCSISATPSLAMAR